jgi:PAS domain S-box-containing protein
MRMRDEHKTREQLLEELTFLRLQLAHLKNELRLGRNHERSALDGSSTRGHEHSGDASRDLGWDVDDYGVPAIDEVVDSGFPQDVQSKSCGEAGTRESATTGSKDVTDSGSFDLRWLRVAAFGKLLEAIPLPILLVNVDGDIQLANKAFLNLARLPDSVVGWSFYSLFPDAEEMRLAEKLLRSVLAIRRPEFTTGLLRLAGNEIWCRMSLRAIRFGSERSVLVLIEDLTAEKRELLANEKFRKLVDVTSMGIAEFVPLVPISCSSSQEWVLNSIPQARVVDGNVELARMLGRPSVAHLKGATLKEVFPFDDNEVHLCESWIRNGFAATSAESKEASATGEINHYENTLVGIVQDCRLMQFWGMRQDITERKRYQEELIEKIRIIDELYEHILQTRQAQAIAEHTAKVAHELRQPLAIIGGFARRMERGAESCDETDLMARHEAFGIIVKEVRRLEVILSSLIDFTQRHSVELQSVDPNEVIRYVLHINTERFAEKGIAPEVSLGEEIGEILLDRECFEQVVRNILAHAVDTAVPGDHIRIETGVSLLTPKAQRTGGLDSDTYFEMKIYHCGKLVPEEELERLFNPFVTTREYGTGIGLTIAKRIIEDHKGSISVNAESEGTLFTVWLPVDRSSSEEALTP